MKPVAEKQIKCLFLWFIQSFWDISGKISVWDKNWKQNVQAEKISRNAR